jgi:hypothetical protein
MYAVGFIHFNEHDLLHFLEGIGAWGGGGVVAFQACLFSLSRMRQLKKLEPFRAVLLHLTTISQYFILNIYVIYINFEPIFIHDPNCFPMWKLTTKK